MMTTLEKNLITLQEKIYELNDDISSLFMIDDEVAKNILMAKNLKMSKADADIMIDGKISEQTKLSILAKEKVKNQLEEQLKNTAKELLTDTVGNSYTTQILNAVDSNNKPEEPLDEPTDPTLENTNTEISQAEEEIKSKEKAAKFAREKGIFPLPKDSPIHNEARNVKNKVRESFMMMKKEYKELVQDLIKTSIDSANAISAAAILIAPLSFNIPGAIVLILEVISSINKIISKVMAIILHCEPLKLLVLLLPKESFESVTSPINAVILGIISILSVVSFFKKLVSKIMSSIKSQTDPANLKNQKQQLKDEISKKGKELNDLRSKKNQDLDAISKKQEEIAELQERLKIMEKGPDIPSMNDNGEFDEKSLSEALKKIDIDLTKQQNDIAQLNLQLYDYVYELKLPDGTIVENLSREDIEEFKNKYKINIDTVNSD